MEHPFAKKENISPDPDLTPYININSNWLIDTKQSAKTEIP